MYSVCCLGGGGRISFCCLGGVRVYDFAVWAGGVLFYSIGRGTGVHSLAGLPGSALKKTTKNQTAKTRVPEKPSAVVQDALYVIHTPATSIDFIFWQLAMLCWNLRVPQSVS